MESWNKGVRRWLGASVLAVLATTMALGSGATASAQSAIPDPGQFTVRTDLPICASPTYHVTVTTPSDVAPDVAMALEVQGPQSWNVASVSLTGRNLGPVTAWTLAAWISAGQTHTYRVVARDTEGTGFVVLHGPETATAASAQACADGDEPIAAPQPDDMVVSASEPTCVSTTLWITAFPLRRLTLTTVELQTRTGGGWATVEAQPIVQPSNAFTFGPVQKAIDYRVIAYSTADPTAFSVVAGPTTVSPPSAEECGTGPEPPIDPVLSRIFGDNRFLTAIAISQDTFPVPAEDFGGIVFLANGLNFPDALAAGPAVAAQGGSLLLVGPRGGLPQETKQEIARLAPDEIVILGKTDNVSALAEADARTLAPVVTRVAGSNRFATSAQLSDLVVGLDENDEPFITDTVIVTSGMTFADALAGGTAGGWELAPLLLTHPSVLDPSVESVLIDREPALVRILGSTATVSAAVETRIRTLLPAVNVVRYDGRNRFETAAMLNADVFIEPGVEVTLTNGLRFPDALAGAARVNVTGGPMVPVTTGCVPAVSFDSIVDLEPVAITALGKADAVSDAALEGEVCP